MQKRGRAGWLLLLALVALAGLALLFWNAKTLTGKYTDPFPMFSTDEKQLCFVNCFEELAKCKERAMAGLQECRLAGRAEGDCKSIAFARNTACTDKNRACRDKCVRTPWTASGGRVQRGVR